jgi:hypothetical protein
MATERDLLAHLSEKQRDELAQLLRVTLLEFGDEA